MAAPCPLQLSPVDPAAHDDVGMDPLLFIMADGIDVLQRIKVHFLPQPADLFEETLDVLLAALVSWLLAGIAQGDRDVLPCVEVCFHEEDQAMLRSGYVRLPLLLRRHALPGRPQPSHLLPAKHRIDVRFQPGPGLRRPRPVSHAPDADRRLLVLPEVRHHPHVHDLRIHDVEQFRILPGHEDRPPFRTFVFWDYHGGNPECFPRTPFPIWR